MAANSYTQNIPDSNFSSKMINSSGVNYNINDTITMEPSSIAFKPLQQQLQQSDTASSLEQQQNSNNYSSQHHSTLAMNSGTNTAQGTVLLNSTTTANQPQTNSKSLTTSITLRCPQTVQQQTLTLHSTPQKPNTPVTTPRGPLLLGGGVALGIRDLTASPSDTLSEPESMRSSSLRGSSGRDGRRRLPDLPPPEQEMAVPWSIVANAKRRERIVNAMMDKFKPFSSSRNVANMDSSFTGYSYSIGSSNKFAINRPGSMSETNLLKYRSQKDGGPMSTARPESALGLLQV